MNQIEWIGVEKRYAGRVALRGLELGVPQGAGLGLLGPNGAGKTTALRLLLGLARPTAGTLRLQGLDPREPASRRGLGYLPERLVLPERLTVKACLELHGKLAGVAPEALEAEVEHQLARTGLGNRGRESIGSLSKGLRQRVGFAQALLGDPAILVLDEPTTGLDPLGVRDARDWIQSARERGCTVLVCSHVLSEVEQTCDRIAILNEGRVAAQGPKAELVADGESLEDVFIRAVRG